MLIKNFSFSILYKLLGFVVSFILVPLLLKLLGSQNYGVWVTFTSLLVWIGLFDFGLGYALKNTVTKSLAKDNLKAAQTEMFQILKITVFITIMLLVGFILVLTFSKSLVSHLYLLLILFIPFIITFPLKIGSAILQGARKNALEGGLLFLNSLLFFITVLILKNLHFYIELKLLAVFFSISYVISTFSIFLNALKTINLGILDLKHIFRQKIDWYRIKIGLKFFGLQLSSLTLYSIGPILVYTYLSAKSVVDFDVINKIFVFGLGIFNIGIAVFWSEISFYREKKNFYKVKKLYFIMLFCALIFSFCALIFSFYTHYFIKLWTSNSVFVEKDVPIYFSFLVSIQAIAYCGAVVLNAFEKINGQLKISIVAALFMAPLSIYFINTNYNIKAIPLTSAILTMISAVYCNLYALKLINNEMKNGNKNSK